MLSTVLQFLSSMWWIYIYQFQVSPRVIELSGLAFFTAFVVTVIIALARISEQASDK